MTFQSELPSLSGEVLKEESIRLIDATCAEEAMSKAIAVGEAAQHEYENDAGQTVKWQFINVAEVQDLCESEVYDGMEVYSFLGWSS